MKRETPFVCPRCDYPLVPVHAVESSRRRVIALACPEPYCDHMQIMPRDHDAALGSAETPANGAIQGTG